MKKLSYTLISMIVLTACGADSGTNSESENNSTETKEQNEVEIPDCPTSRIKFTYAEPGYWDHDADQPLFNDCSFDVKGSAGYLDYGDLKVVIGDQDNDGDMDTYEYVDACTYSVQISLDGAEEKEYDVLDSHTPIQPYDKGTSVAFFGTSSAFPDGETSGTITISYLSESHVCGSFNVTAYHGGVLKGDFSVPLYSKY